MGLVIYRPKKAKYINLEDIDSSKHMIEVNDVK